MLSGEIMGTISMDSSADALQCFSKKNLNICFRTHKIASKMHKKIASSLGSAQTQLSKLVTLSQIP